MTIKEAVNLPFKGNAEAFAVIKEAALAADALEVENRELKNRNAEMLVYGMKLKEQCFALEKEICEVCKAKDIEPSICEGCKHKGVTA